MAATGAGTALTEAHRLAQIDVSKATLASLAEIWPLLDPTALDASFPAYARAATAALAAGKDQSARLAAAYVSALRDAEGVGPLDVTALSALAQEQAMTALLVTGPVALKTSLRSGSTLQRATDVALTQTSGAAIRLVQQGSRDTITTAVASDERAHGYARTTDGHPCYFCALLASRGAVYRSEATASFKAHDACHCQPEPIYHPDYSLPAHAAEWDRLYREAAAGKSGADARSAFRAAYEGRTP